MSRELFPRTVLALAALGFLALGLWFLISPEAVNVTGVAVDSPAARTEVRATYGGLELGLGLFFGWCLLDPARTRAGLVATALTVGGFGAGRTLGLVVDRPPEPIFLTLLAVESLTVALACAALWTSRQRSTPD